MQSTYDYSLFSKVEGNKQVHMIVYLDDLMITGSDETMIDDFKGILKLRFCLEDLGELGIFWDWSWHDQRKESF